MEHSLDKSHAVLIDKETGKVHRINLKPATLHDIQIHSEQPSIGNDWSVECKWVKPLSKRKARKFRYFFVRPFRHLPRKYISKREILDRIYSDYVDKGFARPLWPKEEFMRLTHKNLLAIYTDLCKAYRKWLEYHGAPDEGGYGAGQLDKIHIDKLI